MKNEITYFHKLLNNKPLRKYIHYTSQSINNYYITNKPYGNRIALFIYNNCIYIVFKNETKLLCSMEKNNYINNTIIDCYLYKNKFYTAVDILIYNLKDVRKFSLFTRLKLLNNISATIKKYISYFEISPYINDEKNNLSMSIKKLMNTGSDV